MTAFLQQRDELPAARFCDVSYSDIRQNPVSAARRVYEHFGWSLSGETEQRMQAVLASQPPEENGFHRYDPAQFGLVPDEVAACFATYCERFGLTAPLRETVVTRPAAAR